jgi:xylan 1,4-beta-xylosidase
MKIPEDAIPSTVFEAAHCIAVFPSTIKGGFIIGARKGDGVVSCRTGNGWSAPAYLDMAGGSVGAQIGVQATDYVLMFMTENGINSLLFGKFTLGGEVSAAAGPVGRAAGASTDWKLNARILTYSRSKGLFAGAALKGVVIVRFHELLSDDMGTLICHKEELLYSFMNADLIMDFLLSIGMRPFLELSFMPETLASGSETVFNYRGNVTPPKDYRQWETLINKLVAHWVDRYGVREVSEWFFEVWNEPNLHHFWTGTQEDYFKLYRHTIEAIKGVDDSLKVGGPATAQNEWIKEFLEFCEKNQLPADFITTHYYPTDAFGEPGADTEMQLANAPRTVMRDRAQEARDQARGRPIYYTEWNITSNPRDPLHDQPFAAAFAAKVVMEVAGLVEGYSFWTFSDIFEENYFPSVPFHGGFGVLTLHGIAKPTYRTFELLHRLGTEQLAVEGTHETVDAWVTRKEQTLTLLLTNHALPNHSIKTELVRFRLTNAPEPHTIYLERIDEDHANPQGLWQEMGEPEYLRRLDVERLKAASRVAKEPLTCAYQNRSILLDIDLPPHAVAAITIELVPHLSDRGDLL